MGSDNLCGLPRLTALHRLVEVATENASAGRGRTFVDLAGV